jgi:branched-chain amino acid transport system substrate-binding protein
MVVTLAAVLVTLGTAAVPALAQNEIFVPMLVYRTGPYAPSGTPFANGFHDYMAMINARDGGVNGVKLTWEECETQYDTKQAVECY